MSDRRLFILDTRAKRQGVAKIVSELPAMSRVEVKGPARTLPQNDKMWAMLTNFAEQAVWDGKRRTTLDWKDLFTAAVKVAGGGVEAVPGLEGGLMLLGLHTSDLSVAEMADVITYMDSKATELGVILSDSSQEPEVAQKAPRVAA
jgi:hypothetical protein